MKPGEDLARDFGIGLGNGHAHPRAGVVAEGCFGGHPSRDNPGAYAERLQWRLSVADDGVGMPSAEGSKAGLGSSIVRALAAQLRADIKVVWTAPGTMVVVERRGRADAAPDRLSPIPLLV